MDISSLAFNAGILLREAGGEALGMRRHSPGGASVLSSTDRRCIYRVRTFEWGVLEMSLCFPGSA